MPGGSIPEFAAGSLSGQACNLHINTWIHYLKRVGSPVEARLRQTPAAEVAVCSVVWAELLHGAQKYEKREERVARIAGLTIEDWTVP